MRRGVGALLASAVLLVSGCSQDLLDGESDLVLFNDSACTLTIWVDGREAFSLQAGSERILDGIGPGQHMLEAVDPKGRVVERRSIDLAVGEDFYWTLSSC